MALDKLIIGYRFLKQAASLARARPTSPYTTADLIEKQAAARANHPFCLAGDRVVTYAEYNAEANRVAHWASSAGLRRGDVVALLMLNRPEYLQTWAGLAKLGVTVALINTNLTGKGLRHALEAARVRHLIVGTECLESFATMGDDVPEGLEVFVSCPKGEAERAEGFPSGANDMERALSGQPTVNPDRKVREGLTAGDDLFYIYTSGTTGLPKAARFSHLKFMATGSVAAIAGFGKHDTMYIALPLYHSAGGAMAVSTTLGAGGTLALREKFSASRFWEDIRKYDATAFQYIGEFCRYLLNVPEHELDGQHKIKFAFGNGLRPDIWEEFRDRFALPKIVEFYGATEGNVALLNLDGTVGSIGRMPPRFYMDGRLVRYDVAADEYIRDENGWCIECKPGEIGELIGAVPTRSGDTRGRFEGYTSKEATEKKVLRDAFKKGDAWFRTGDLLRCDEKGYYYFVDRIGDTYRWKGENVSTQDVAESLSAYPGVEMVNVYGVEVPGQDGRAGMAGLALENPESFDGAAFLAHVKESLPAYAAPVFLRVMLETEVTGTFKLRKVDLQREGFDPSVVSEPLYVRDDVKGAYVQLTPEVHAAVLSGSLRV
ncbi:MAG: long-chain-acyl-CoA synthetase [Deltaproteobacteria bacterium]|nr:long-chain-acyl-CoA synthetase [Deltaproteobacteria bacterium]